MLAWIRVLAGTHGEAHGRATSGHANGHIMDKLDRVNVQHVQLHEMEACKTHLEWQWGEFKARRRQNATNQLAAEVVWPSSHGNGDWQHLIPASPTKLVNSSNVACTIRDHPVSDCDHPSGFAVFSRLVCTLCGFP